MTHAAGHAFQTGNGTSSSVTGQLPGGRIETELTEQHSNVQGCAFNTPTISF